MPLNNLKSKLIDSQNVLCVNADEIYQINKIIKINKLLSGICQRCKKVNKLKTTHFDKLILNTFESYTKINKIQTDSNEIKNISKLSGNRIQSSIVYLPSVNGTNCKKNSIIVFLLKIFSQIFGNSIIKYI